MLATSSIENVMRMVVEQSVCVGADGARNVGEALLSLKYPEALLYKKLTKHRKEVFFYCQKPSKLVFSLSEDFLVLRQPDQDGHWVLKLTKGGVQRAINLLNKVGGMQAQRCLWCVVDHSDRQVQNAIKTAKEGEMGPRSNGDYRVNGQENEDVMDEQEREEGDQEDEDDDDDDEVEEEEEEMEDEQEEEMLQDNQQFDLSTGFATSGLNNIDSTGDDEMLEWSNIEELRAHLDAIRSQPDFDEKCAKMRDAVAHHDDSAEAKALRRRVVELYRRHPEEVRQVEQAIKLDKGSQ